MTRILASVLLVLAVVGGAWADEPPAHDIVVALFASGERSPLQSFVGNGLVLELTRNRFRATLVEADGPPPAANDRRAAARLAQGTSAPLVLAGVYTVRGSEIDITLQALEVEGSRLLATARRTARIDLALDEPLISAVQELVPAMAAMRDRNQERFPPKPAAPAAAAAALAAVVSPVEPAPVAPAAPAAPSAPAAPAAPSEPARAELSRGVVIAVGAAPLVPAGDLAVFLGTGVAASVHAELQWRRGDSLLAVGLGTGATLFQAEGPLDSAGGVLAPLLLEGRWGIASAGGMAFYARGGAGAAFFRVDSDNEGALSKITPCATASLGLSRSLGERLALALDVTYAVYVDTGPDSTDLIMGLAPGLQLFFSL